MQKTTIIREEGKMANIMNNSFTYILTHLKLKIPKIDPKVNLEKQIDNGEKMGVLFMDFSKVFHRINYSLLVAKLKTYGFSDQALSLLQSYLFNRLHRFTINGSFSSWNEVITEVTQGAILGPLIFNRFLNDTFLFISNCHLCNYDNSLYESGKIMQKIIINLEMDFMILHKYFLENHMIYTKPW